MACNCRGTGPGVVLIGGSGVDVTGAGTPESPFQVSTSELTTPIIEVHDSPTVGMTITGSGTLDDPYIIQSDASSAASLQGLSDVISDAPVVGSVPTWVAATSSVAAHWEFRVPAITVNGGALTSVSTSILAGTIASTNLPDRLKEQAALLATGTDLNTVQLTGWYRGSGITNAPGSSWWYFEVIQHTNQYILQRAANFFAPYNTLERRLNNGAWTAWTTLATNESLNSGFLDTKYASVAATVIATSAGSAAAGWQLNRFNLMKVNHVVTVDISVTRTGAQIASPTSGNITNVLIGNVGAWTPYSDWAPIASGADGVNAAFSVQKNGDVYLTALPPSVPCNTGDPLSAGGSYISAS